MVFNIKPGLYSQKFTDMIYNEKVSKINKHLYTKDTYNLALIVRILNVMNDFNDGSQTAGQQ